jgi:hypothetical protein
MEPIMNKLLDLLPNRVFCREIKLLYKSGRLVDGFYGKDLDLMALTRFEKMFVSWAMRKWREENKRQELKEWATKLAITGKDENADPFVPTFNTIPYTGKNTNASLRLSLAEMELAMEDARRKAESSKVFQKTPKDPAKL